MQSYNKYAIEQVEDRPEKCGKYGCTPTAGLYGMKKILELMLGLKGKASG
jgi:hypothetical protein